MRTLMTILLLLGCHAASAASAASAAKTGLSASFDLTKHVIISEWMSKNWMPTQSVGGDLTGDGLPDMAVVLLRTYTTSSEPEYPEGTRALALFVGHNSGEYRLHTRAAGILPCLYCLGSVAGIPELATLDLEIEDQVLGVRWLQGHHDSEMASIHLRIGYDKAKRAFHLLSDETLTIDRIGQRHDRRLRNYQTGEVTTGNGTRVEKPRFIPLDDVDAFDF